MPPKNFINFYVLKGGPNNLYDLLEKFDLIYIMVH